MIPYAKICYSIGIFQKECSSHFFFIYASVQVKRLGSGKNHLGKKKSINFSESMKHGSKPKFCANDKNFGEELKCWPEVGS